MKGRITTGTGTVARVTIAKVIVAIAICAVAAPQSHAAVSAKEYHFRGAPDGSEPDGALLSDGAGNFYGTTPAAASSPAASARLFAGPYSK